LVSSSWPHFCLTPMSISICSFDLDMPYCFKKSAYI
jgi:hypothetical protein